MPPGSVRNASALSSIIFLRSRMVSTTCSSVGVAVGDLPGGQALRDDAEGVRAAGTGFPRDRAHHRRLPATPDEVPAARGDLAPHLGGEVDVALRERSTRPAVDGDVHQCESAHAWCASLTTRTASSMSSVRCSSARSFSPTLPPCQHRALDPVVQPLPVARAEEHDRELRDLLRLHQGQRLEQLVERAEPARQADERLRVLDEHRLAHEEVPEVHAEVDPRVEALLERQLDAEPDREPTGLRATAVDRLHRAGSTTGDRREPGLAPAPRRGHARACTRGGHGRCAPTRTRSPRWAPRPARRNPRRTRPGSAAPATGRCAPSPSGRASRAAAGRWW